MKRKNLLLFYRDELSHRDELYIHYILLDQINNFIVIFLHRKNMLLYDTKNFFRYS